MQDCDRLVGEWETVHGFMGNSSWVAPLRVSFCDEVARPGYAPIKAHEYNDDAAVLREKIQVLASLMCRSENCVIYSGAGISTSSGIGDYATKTAGKKKSLLSGFVAKPTLSHRAIVSMYKAGLVKYWIQQNHDGLPQKAGMPQESINEIHGAWFDPSNPVVPMSGSLRSDLCEDMEMWIRKADLTLSVGTSMCGMNADRVFTSVCERARSDSKRKQSDDSVCLGGVIIGIQQTQHDQLASLHIYARIDEVMSLLLEELRLTISNEEYAPDVPDDQRQQDIYAVPYSRYGFRYRGSNGRIKAIGTSGRTTSWDLTPGSRHRIVSGPFADDEGVMIGKSREGHYRVNFTHTLNNRSGEHGEPYTTVRVIGSWWTEAAVKGTVPSLPTVNC